jgi:hypothetical protein
MPNQDPASYTGAVEHVMDERSVIRHRELAVRVRGGSEAGKVERNRIHLPGEDPVQPGKVPVGDANPMNEDNRWGEIFGGRREG